MLLAQMVVEYAADTSKLQAGVVAAAKTQKMMQDQTTSTTRSMSTGFQNASRDAQYLAGQTNTGSQALSKMGNVAKGVAAVGVAALAAALLALAAAAVSSVQKAADYEETLNQIYATNDITKESVNQLGNALLQLGPKVGKGPQDLAESLYYVMGAGYDASRAMQIVEISAKSVAGTAIATTVPANALTAALKAFPGLEVAQAMDMITVAVATGKTEMGTFAPAVGQVSLFAQMAGANFGEAAAALSTLTNVMPSTEQAATSLRSLFQTSSSIANLAQEAGKLGIAFDTNAYSAMSFIDRLKYLQQITGGNTESLKQLLGQEEAMPAIQALLTNGAHDYASALDKITNSAGATDAAFQKTSEGTKAAWARAGAALEALQIKIGTALLPAINAFSDKIAPLIMQMMDWADKNHVLENAISAVGTAFNTLVSIGSPVLAFFQNNQAAMQALRGTLIGIGVVVGGLLVGAFAAWAVSVIAATWPLLLIIAGVAALGAGFMLLYNNVAPFREFMNSLGQVFLNLWNIISSNFMPVMSALGQILAQVGAFLVATFKPAWDQLVTTVQTQLVPAWQSLMTALQPAIPLLQFIGSIILGVVVIALGVFLSTVVGLVQGIAGALPGIIQAFGGVVQFISGAIQVITGIITFFVHLFTGQFDKLGGDLTRIWTGIATMFAGIGNVIVGVFRTFIGLVVGYVSGFISTIIGFFTYLYNTLIGHSIIPALISGMTGYFAQLLGMPVQYVSSMVSTILGKLNGLATDALNAGANIVNQIAAGIRSAIGNVAGAIQWVVQYISDHLPKSPAKLGPLRDLAYQGEQIVGQVSRGMMGGLPQLESAIGDVTKPVSLSLAPIQKKATSVPSSRTEKDRQKVELHLHINSREVAQAVIDDFGEVLVQRIRLEQGIRR